MKANLLTTFLVLLVLTLAVAQGAVRGVPDKGGAIFAERCAGCHGTTGGGDGPLAPFLSPRPASLISAGTSVKTDEELLHVIANGKPKTAMPAWKDLLSEQERLDVVAYIRALVTFHPKPLTPGPPNLPN
jgi:mono/diheme cytochrome c family protein